jgi:hypothetical protein
VLVTWQKFISLSAFVVPSNILANPLVKLFKIHCIPLDKDVIMLWASPCVAAVTALDTVLPTPLTICPLTPTIAFFTSFKHAPGSVNEQEGGACVVVVPEVVGVVAPVN